MSERKNALKLTERQMDLLDALYGRPNGMHYYEVMNVLRSHGCKGSSSTVGVLENVTGRHGKLIKRDGEGDRCVFYLTDNGRKTYKAIKEAQDGISE